MSCLLRRYEQAADLVDGIPQIDIAESHAPTLGKLAGPVGGAAQIGMAVSGGDM